MSEFQYIGFRATEKPVGDRDLEYVRQQSTRAEITPWSFDNVYHFGDLHGDAQPGTWRDSPVACVFAGCPLS
jgi:hypothetical protein